MKLKNMNDRLPKEYAILRIRYKKLKAEYDELKEQLKQNYIKNESSLKIKNRECLYRKDNTETIKMLFKGKRLDNGEWVEGSSLGPSFDSNYYIVTYVIGNLQVCGECACPFDCDDLYEVDPATVGQFTGFKDKNGTKIFKGDITELVLDDGEIRHFIVDIKTVTRTIVSHSTFDDATTKVEITGVVFLWNGFELFPCVDSKGISDVSKMKVVGNVHDNKVI